MRAIAFYLPQYHPIPENDEWWGKGFTEWTNVAKARPLFPGHYQPHLPADLGYYDLRVPEVRQAQADLAREYGIHGFCYYHYWFNGKRLLERPFKEVLESGKPDFPFCLCWANENWTRRWDGHENEILIRQTYSDEDDLNHIRSLIPMFSDSRYIKINGKPLLLIYRAKDLPDSSRTAERWRTEVQKAGFPDLYLCSVASSPILHLDAKSMGFDALVDFPPNSTVKKSLRKLPISSRIRKIFKLHSNDPYHLHRIFDYDLFSKERASSRAPGYKIFPCVMPGWDNTARRKSGGYIFDNSNPESYGRWLRAAKQSVQLQFSPDEQIVFINAWNEWGEGNHLEPDHRWGRAYLEETRRVLDEIGKE